MAAGSGGPDLVQVKILGAPVALWLQTQEHSEELIREFMLIAADVSPDGEHAVPARLIGLISELTSQFGGFSAGNEQRLADAGAAGEAEVDLVYELPVGIDSAVERLGEQLDAADEYCRAGQHLLTLATPPDQARFRRWFLGEFSRQARGGSPVPWAEYSTD
jgi:hypothetical protein